MTLSSLDGAFMRAAAALSRRGLGQTWPNPSVGALLVRYDGFSPRVIGAARTAKGGRPHAEPQVLDGAGEAAYGATLYVTLEPCSHHGQTPPCVDAIVRAGVSRVVVGLLDPDPRVSGRGVEHLRQAGILVDVGVASEACSAVLKGYLLRQTLLRPYVTCKVALAKNGVVASQAGDPRLLVSSKASQPFVHALRAQHDAIVVGATTFRLDAPQLTVRLEGYSGRQPLKVVLDRSGQLDTLPDDWLCVREVELPHAFRMLAEKGLTKILVEPGPHLATALMQQSLVDEVVLLRASHDAVGLQGYPFWETFAKDTCWQQTDELILGADHVFSFSKQV